MTYVYNAEPNEPQAGSIAEEVPDVVATNSRHELSPMDFVAALTKVVQDQDRLLVEQRKQLNDQANALATLTARLEKISQLVEVKTEE